LHRSDKGADGVEDVSFVRLPNRVTRIGKEDDLRRRGGLPNRRREPDGVRRVEGAGSGRSLAMRSRIDGQHRRIDVREHVMSRDHLPKHVRWFLRKRCAWAGGIDHTGQAAQTALHTRELDVSQLPTQLRVLFIGREWPGLESLDLALKIDQLE